MLIPSVGREAGQADGWLGRHWVGSAWQNGTFVLSGSRTGRGPFNELFWLGQPAKSIFTLMLGLMAKPASKPAVARGGRGVAACMQGGSAAGMGEGEAGARGRAGRGGISSRHRCPRQRGQTSRFCRLCICWGFFLSMGPSPLPTLPTVCTAGAVFVDVGSSQVCPPPRESPVQPTQPLAGLCQEPNTVTV